jgi:hypothetical protein
MTPRIGDIFQVPLPDGRFAYGKVFRDASVGIYETIFDTPASLPIKSTFVFMASMLTFSNQEMRGLYWQLRGRVAEAQRCAPPFTWTALPQKSRR